MPQIATARGIDRATSDETFKKLLARLAVHRVTSFRVPESELRTNVILKNVGNVPIRSAIAAIHVYSPTGPVRVDGLTNDAHRFANDEISYDVQRFDPFADSGQTLYFSISIRPADSRVAIEKRV
jgi:hypothetical protein